MSVPSEGTFFKRYLLSAFIFKSVLIGGGYATGRELVEFFLSRGPVTGLVGIVVAAGIFSVILTVSFELARRFRCYDYRSFFQILLGPAWILFDVAFLSLMLLVLSVLGAASGEIVAHQFGCPPLLGTLALMALIAAIVFYGTKLVERFFAGWSVVLYGAYIFFFLWSVTNLGGDIHARWSASRLTDGGVVSGVIYAGYSMAVIPSILYCARHFSQRRDAIISGVLAGPIAMIPAVLLFFIMVARYPEVDAAHVPIVYMLAEMHSPLVFVGFQIVIFGTLVETGTGLIHGFNERVADVIRERGGRLQKWQRATIAFALLTISIFLASMVGIVDLIGRGYRYSTYAFLGLMAVPLLTRGVWLVSRPPPRSPDI